MLSKAGLGPDALECGAHWPYNDSAIKALAAAGHGLWADAEPAPGDALSEGSEGVGVFALQAGLTRLGYDCPPSGQFDAATRDIVTAFQRHWVQSRFDGVADGLTRARLMAVIRAAAA
jgi:N-acetylmuramoyl-L-alanine amidase